MKKSALFSDLFFCFFVVALATLCLLRYLRFSLSLAAFFASIGGILFTVPLFILLDKKSGRLLLKKKEEKELKQLMLYLTLSTKKELSALFFDVYQKNISREKEEKKTKSRKKSEEKEKLSDLSDSSKDTEKNLIKMQTFGDIYAVSTPEELIFYRFSFSEDNGEFIEKVLRANTKKRKIVLCPRLNENEKKLLKNYAVETLPEDKIYLLFKDNDLLPNDFKKYEPTQKKKIQIKKELWFSKNNSRPFFTGAVLLLISSLFTPFPYYYLIIGFILLFCAVFVRIFGFR